MAWAARRTEARRFPRWLVVVILTPTAMVAIGIATAWLMLRASLPVLDGRVRGNGLAATVTVDRDALGVPTIRGGDRDDVAYGTGFLHMLRTVSFKWICCAAQRQANWLNC
jgi:penicillin amidase